MLLENKSLLIHVTCEVVVLGVLIFWVSRKTNNLWEQVDDLSQRLEDQEEKLHNHERIIKQLIETINSLRLQSVTKAPKTPKTPKAPKAPKIQHKPPVEHRVASIEDEDEDSFEDSFEVNFENDEDNNDEDNNDEDNNDEDDEFEETESEMDEALKDELAELNDDEKN